MWQVVLGLMAVDRSWSAYENFFPKDEKDRTHHNFLKGGLNLLAACTMVCYMFNKVNWGRMFSGKPPKS
ncbi:MAG: hypothetical protein LBR79_04250 [Oscillospiraceae bacterium]|nr:hypothetical protein [Oscillospiraceae bacterium]